MNSLGIITVEPEDQEKIDSEVERLLKAGWEEKDVRYLMRSLEEVNPDMDEHEGCERIARMKEKYNTQWW